MRTKKGFTLIELLVVISIVSLLSSIILGQLNDARAKSRDARRIAELDQIRKALELYRDDNGLYPIINPSCSGVRGASHNPPSGNCFGNRWTSLQTALSNYMSPLPIDLAVSRGYAYAYYSNVTGSNYALTAYFETENQSRCGLKNYTMQGEYDDIGIFFNVGTPWCPGGDADPDRLLYVVSPP